MLPSIPGYGFSGPTRRPGWDVQRIAAAMVELMHRLGYERYGAHGGDWGASISRQMGLLDPDHVLGLHVIMLLSPPSGDPEEMAELTEDERHRLEAGVRFRRRGSGYSAIQSTRPQTLAHGLTDSPAGLLVWIAEKFKEWTACTDLPEEAVNRDQLLTNVTVCWLTGTANSSARLSYAFGRSGGAWQRAEPSTVPTGVAVFPHEIAPPIGRFAERTNRIVHWTEFDRGGHFAAMEEPDLLVADLCRFFRRFRDR